MPRPSSHLDGWMERTDFGARWEGSEKSEKSITGTREWGTPPTRRKGEGESWGAESSASSSAPSFNQRSTAATGDKLTHRSDRPEWLAAALETTSAAPGPADRDQSHVPVCNWEKIFDQGSPIDPKLNLG